MSAIDVALTVDSYTALYLSLFVFVLTLQKLYHSVISRANTKARNLHCQLQKYENPPNESRDVKYLRMYSLYVLGSEIITLVVALAFVTLSVVYVAPLVLSLVMTLLGARCWRKTLVEIEC
jgi:hypothetical protein